MSKTFYIRSAGKLLGPTDLSRVALMRRNGMAGPDAMVSDDQVNWQNIDEFLGQLAPDTPPLPAATAEPAPATPPGLPPPTASGQPVSPPGPGIPQQPLSAPGTQYVDQSLPQPVLPPGQAPVVQPIPPAGQPVVQPIPPAGQPVVQPIPPAGQPVVPDQELSPSAPGDAADSNQPAVESPAGAGPAPIKRNASLAAIALVAIIILGGGGLLLHFLSGPSDSVVTGGPAPDSGLDQGLSNKPDDSSTGNLVADNSPFSKKSALQGGGSVSNFDPGSKDAKGKDDKDKDAKGTFGKTKGDTKPATNKPEPKKPTPAEFPRVFAYELAPQSELSLDEPFALRPSDSASPEQRERLLNDAVRFEVLANPTVRKKRSPFLLGDDGGTAPRPLITVNTHGITLAIQKTSKKHKKPRLMIAKASKDSPFSERRYQQLRWAVLKLHRETEPKVRYIIFQPAKAPTERITLNEFQGRGWKLNSKPKSAFTAARPLPPPDVNHHLHLKVDKLASAVESTPTPISVTYRANKNAWGLRDSKNQEIGELSLTATSTSLYIRLLQAGMSSGLEPENKPGPSTKTSGMGTVVLNDQAVQKILWTLIGDAKRDPRLRKLKFEQRKFRGYLFSDPNKNTSAALWHRSLFWRQIDRKYDTKRSQQRFQEMIDRHQEKLFQGTRFLQRKKDKYFYPTFAVWTTIPSARGRTAWHKDMDLVHKNLSLLLATAGKKPAGKGKPTSTTNETPGGNDKSILDGLYLVGSLVYRVRDNTRFIDIPIVRFSAPGPLGP